MPEFLPFLLAAGMMTAPPRGGHRSSAYICRPGLRRLRQRLATEKRPRERAYLRRVIARRLANKAASAARRRRR